MVKNIRMRAKTVDEYVDWIKQAKFEVKDLKDCFEYHLEEQGSYPAFLVPLEAQINGLYEQMEKGEYQWGREDLPLLELARKHANDIPFVHLLVRINETHRYGLDVQEE